MKFEHIPVLLEEVITYLDPQANENFVDCTLGGGGHAIEILKKTRPGGKLLGIDLDQAAVKAAQDKLTNFQKRIVLVCDNYINIKKIVYDHGFNKINGILLDLGLSSYQLQDKTRGFSFQENTRLDMRFGGSGLTAADILNTYPEKKLINIFREYGEERYSQEIANQIVVQRKESDFEKTKDLVSLIERVYQRKPKPKNIHVATKIFQALRIEVNNELNNIRTVLKQALELLEPNGRLVVISFHSLEDKIVKEFFKQESKECHCPPQFPVCNCNHQKQLKILTKKVVIPKTEEIKQNLRSRSAKLRAAMKIIK